MFNEFYNLKQSPFSETPDIEFYFRSRSQELALYRLVQMIDNGLGFGLLTGEVGLGKTILSRVLMDVGAKKMNSALIFYPKLEGKELFITILEEFGETPDKNANVKELFDHVTDYLIQTYKAGKKSLLIVDEAQNLSIDSLEIVRMLSNIEMDNEKLIHIILVGQPELRETLSSYECRQINQRISTRIELLPFDAAETSKYIKSRIEISGGSNFVRFGGDAVFEIQKFAGGNPRLINLICNTVLSYSESLGARLITKTHVEEALVKNKLIKPQRSIFGKIFGHSKMVQS